MRSQRNAGGSTEDDFQQTAEEMLIDARTLRSSERHRNTCYLAGYVVECVLKVLVEMASLNPAKRTHSLSLLREQVLVLSLSAGQSIAKYGDPLRFARTMITGGAAEAKSSGGQQQPCDWDPVHRYNGSRWSDPAKSSAYLQEAERALAILNEIALDGGLR